MFITFEGTEGSGKSTQIRLLAAALLDRGYGVVVTREPGGTALGDSLRAMLLDAEEAISAEAEAYLMTAARAEHVRRVIRPALDAGRIVLCDRFADSTLAYQGAGRGISVGALRDLQRLAIGATWPNMTILLDVPVSVGLDRRLGNGRTNRIDREDLAFHERVAAWFRAESTRDDARWRVVDGTQQPHAVQTAILNVVLAKLLHAPSEGGGAVV